MYGKKAWSRPQNKRVFAAAQVSLVMMQRRQVKSIYRMDANVHVVEPWYDPETPREK
jgi:hypothetical protein